MEAHQQHANGPTLDAVTEHLLDTLERDAREAIVSARHTIARSELVLANVKAVKVRLAGPQWQLTPAGKLAVGVKVIVGGEEVTVNDLGAATEPDRVHVEFEGHSGRHWVELDCATELWEHVAAGSHVAAEAVRSHGGGLVEGNGNRP